MRSNTGTSSASWWPFAKRLRTIRFYALDEEPVLLLAVSQDSLRWLIELIPKYDEARRRLQKELDALSGEP